MAEIKLVPILEEEKIVHTNSVYTVEVKNYGKAYDHNVAVKNVSFSIKRNEIFGLLGPNGAGKTTILESIVGLRVPTSGSVRVFGFDPVSQREKVLAHIGIQPQEAGLFPNLKVGETLELFAGLYEKPRSVQETVSLIGLQDKVNTPLKKLSGGQKQRLLVGVSLISDPDILLLDEPTASLDPQARRYIWEVIQNMKKRGRSVILTTHSMEEAYALCDRVAILDQGRIIAEGPPQDLIYKHFPKQQLIFETASAVDIHALPRLSETADITASKMENGDSEVRITATPLTRDLLHALANAQIFQTQEWKNIRIESGTLEDVFLALTGKQIREEESDE